MELYIINIYDPYIDRYNKSSSKLNTISKMGRLWETRKLRKKIKFEIEIIISNETIALPFITLPATATLVLISIQTWCSGSGPPGTILSDPTSDRECGLRCRYRSSCRWKSRSLWRRRRLLVCGATCSWCVVRRTRPWEWEVRKSKEKAHKRSNDMMGLISALAI